MTEYQVTEQVGEQTHAEGQLIMPFYIICDTSGSMSGEMAALQRDLTTLVAEIASDYVASDTTMLSIIVFGSGARTIVPLSDPGTIQVPALPGMGGTNFSDALNEYHRAFTADYTRLRAEGSKVFRPCVFFLTDGEAGDNWEQTFQTLLAWNPHTRTGNMLYPYIVAYGFRDATEQTLKKLAYPNFGEKLGKWFFSRTNNVSELLKSMIGTIGKTIVSSGQSVPTGQPQLILPPAVSSGTTVAGEPDILP